MTGIVGPNGSGKTTAINAAYVGITGDWARFEHDKRDQIISQFAKPDEKAGVRVLMEHHGVQAEIIRMLRPNSRRLIIGTDEPITSDKAITAKIEQWFGLPLKVIGQYIFVNQWEMFSILSESPTERSKDLYRLFGIDQAEACWSAIGDHLKLLDSKVPEVDVDAVRSRLLSNRSRLRDLEANLRAANNRIPSDESLTQLQAVVDGWEWTLDLMDQISNLESSLNQLNVSREEQHRAAQRLEQALNSTREKVQEFENKVQSYAAIEADWRAYRQLKAIRHMAQERLNSLQLAYEYDYNRFPEKPANVIDDIAPLEQEVKAKERQLERAEEFLEHIHEDVAVCPTCFTPVEQLKDQIDKFKLDVDILVPAINKLWELIEESRSYKDKLQRWQIWKAEQDQKLQEAKQQLDSLPTLEPPMVPENLITNTREEYQDYRRAAQEIEATLGKTQRELANLNGMYSVHKQEFDKLNYELESLQMTEEDAIFAKATLDVRQLETQERARLQAEIAVVKRSITDDETALEEAAATIKSAEKVNNLHSELSAVRDIMHREALPRMVAQSQLSLLETRMNKFLEDLGIDFRVKAKDGLKYQVIFNDGIRQVPAETLSGGEKVVFALAWRLAVNAQFAADIGVLCLDEPTAGLDKDRLGCLKLAIEKMKTMSKTSGLQCVIITHAEGLMPLFDRVIELSPPQPI